jgi:16S rRNA (cytidine1402-2'-O)-methyltransferase
MLYLVATPIGNLEDISARAARVLREADAIACEDTRRTRILLSHLDIPRPREMISYREQTERRAGPHIVALAERGLNVAVCSDGGYPGISDPGYRLVQLALERGIEFAVIPGPSAVPVALLLSGLPTSSYTFKGFPPRKPGPRRRFFEQESGQPHSLVVFESPFRVAQTLASAAEVFGDRQAAVCLELTKKFERVSRGSLPELAAAFAGQKLRGEATIVIEGERARRGDRPPQPDEPGGPDADG